MYWGIPHKRRLPYRSTEGMHRPSTPGCSRVAHLIQVNRVIDIVHVKVLKGDILEAQ